MLQDLSWVLQDAAFEKMGALMSDNSGRFIGLYDLPHKDQSFLWKGSF